MSNVIPNGWIWNKVNQFTSEHKQGYYTKDAYTGKGTYLIRITDMNNPRIDYTKMPKLEIDEKEYSQFKVEIGDFLFARSGAIGRYGIVEEKFPAVFASYLIRFRFDNEQVSTRYFGYTYESDLCQRQLGAITQGSSNININADNIKSLSIPLPPLPEQKKIAAILSSVDEVIEKTQAQINKLKDLKTGMMQELLSPREGQAANINNPQGESKNSLHHTEFKDSPLGRIPVDWEVRKFGDITLEHKQGFYSKDKYTADGTYLIRITDMQNPYISFTEMPKMIISDKDKEAYKVLNGDFLFARSGAIGRYGIFDSSNEAVFASYLIRFRFNLEKALNEFVGFWYESDVCQKQLGTITQGSSNININALNIKELKIPIPSINEQQKITQAILSVVRKTTVFQRKLNTLKNTKKALMQDLLTGKVRVTVD